MLKQRHKQAEKPPKPLTARFCSQNQTQVLPKTHKKCKNQLSYFGGKFARRLVFQQCWHRLQSAMIKFSSLRLPLHFSTIRYPDYAVKAFSLNKSIRTCLSLIELQNYIKEHDRQIKQYGKTIILDFIYKSKDSSLTVYRYALELTDLNIYEEQLKQGALIKYKEYSTWQGYPWQSVIESHQRQLEVKIEKTPFDIVDAFNWIIIKRSLKCNKLFLHAIDIISDIAKEDYSYKYSRLLPIVLKRMEELEWSSLRECKKLFRFVCYEYKLSIETLKQVTSIIERFTELKLHAVGYARVPSALDDAFLMIENNFSQIGSQSLLNAFESFVNLPIYYNPRAYTGFFGSICSRLQKQPVFLQMLPLNRMTERDIEKISQLTFTKDFNIVNCIYFMNMVNGKVMFRSKHFVTKLEQVFFGFLKKKHLILRNDHQAIICVARSLIQHHFSNPQKLEHIHTTLKQIHEHFLTELRECDLINMASLQNQLAYIHFDIEIDLMKNKKAFYKMIEDNIANFTHRKMYSTWKIRKHNAQIVESLAIFLNTKHKKILTHIKNIVRKQIEIKEDFNQSFVMEYIFYLQKSKNRQFFQKTIDYYYSGLDKKKFLALAEIYNSRFYFKSAKGTEEVIRKIYQHSKQFAPIGKIITGVAPINLADHQFELNKSIASILNEITFNEKTDMMNEFNLLQITSMISLCSIFSERLQNFTKNLLDYLAATLEKSYKELSKYTSLEDQIFFWKAMENMRRFAKNSFHRQFFDQYKAIEEQMKLNHPKLIDMIEIEKIETQIYKSFDKQKEILLLQPQIEKILTKNLKNQQKSGHLIKIHLLLFLQRNICPSCRQYEPEILSSVKNAFRSYQLNLNELRIVLNEHYYNLVEKKKLKNMSNIRDIILFAFQIDCKQDRTNYLYFMRLGLLLGLNQVVEICMKELLILDMEPFQFVEVMRIAQQQNIKLESRIFEPLHKSELFELMYALSTKDIDIKAYFDEHTILKESFFENERFLLNQVATIIENPQYKQLEKRDLNQKLFKYYSIAIHSDMVSNKTLQIFKFNIQFFSQLNTFHKNHQQIEEYYISLYLLQRYEKTPQEDLVEIKETKVVKPTKSTFFSAKKEIEQAQKMKANILAEQTSKRPQKKITLFRQNLFKNPPVENKSPIFESILKSQGLKPKSEQQSSRNKYYETMYTCGNITLSIYIQDFEKKYGIVYFFDKNAKQRKPLIIEKILSKHLGFPVSTVNTFNPKFNLPR